MCVVSTIPTLNPALAMSNTNTKSKTTLNSGGGFGGLTVKSNRGKVSPFKADQQLLNAEIDKKNKDETRSLFTTFVENLPQI